MLQNVLLVSAWKVVLKRKKIIQMKSEEEKMTLSPFLKRFIIFGWALSSLHWLILLSFCSFSYHGVQQLNVELSFQCFIARKKVTMENERSISLGRTILACIVVWNERVESKLGKDHSIRRKTARTLLIKDYANSLTNKICWTYIFLMISFLSTYLKQNSLVKRSQKNS